MVTLPIDANNKEIQMTPKGTVLAVTYDATISSATDITLNASTTYIEVSAIDKGVFLKYGSTVTTSDFSEFISANTTRAYCPPSGTTIISLIQESATAKAVVIEK